MELEQAVVQTFNSYRQGLRKGPSGLRNLPDRDFAMLYLSGSIGRVPVRERRLLREMKACCLEGLERSRQGRLEEAAELYERAELLLLRLRDGTEINHQLGISAYQSSIAYWFSKRGEWAAAEECLLRAMDADARLEECGFPVMQLHRIQQGHNLVRLLLYQGRRQEAIELTAHLYNYVEGTETTLPYHRNWRPETIRAVPDALARFLLLALLSEVAAFLCTGEDRDGEWGLFFRHASIERPRSAFLFSQLRDYLLARHSLAKGDELAYLQNLRAFFDAGIRDCPILWYSALVEFRDWCAHKPWHVAEKVRSLLARDSAKWKAVPPALAALFVAESVESA